MSNENHKADQIAYRVFAKLSLVVTEARVTAESKPNTKVDRWFNLETPDFESFKEQLRIYRSISVTPSPPPLELQVLLTVPDPTHKEVLVHLAPDGSRTRIDSHLRFILLESWVLTFTRCHSTPNEGSDRSDIAPSTIYKHGIPLFRSIYTLLRVLPTWRLYKRLRRRAGGYNRSGNFNILLHVAATEASEHILDFDMPPSQGFEPLTNETYTFPSIPHPIGTLTVLTRYLTSVDFQLDELESLLSSRFLSLDGPEFTPTLSKNQPRDSLNIPGSPGSLPTRTALPISPPDPGPVSVADKFVLPLGHSRAISLPGSLPSARDTPPPISRNPSSGGPGSTSGISVSSLGRQDSNSPLPKDDGKYASALPPRLRKESSGAGRGTDTGVPGSLPIRRPNINPFKSSTLSSGSPSLPSPSPSIRNPPSLSSVHSRPIQTPPRIPLSPMGVSSRPSPPFTPSSLGDRRSLTSTEGDEISPKPLGRKRYSSSFGHRYATVSGHVSDGSIGSGERREGERPSSASFLSTNTDDDDISAFVQDIDSRRPLNGHDQTNEQFQEPLLDLANTPAGPSREGSYDIDLTPSENYGNNRDGVSGAMLTSEPEVDQKLTQMNSAFLVSLEGLERNRRAKKESPSHSVDPPHQPH